MSKKLKIMLIKRGLKQKWLCQSTGIHKTVMSQICNDLLNPTEQQKIRIAAALNEPLKKLF